MSVGAAATADHPDDVPFALSTKLLGTEAVLMPPLFEVANDGKFSSVALVLVIPAKVELGASSL